MRKVLVTGGAGFIGRYVAEELERRDLEPVVFDCVLAAREDIRDAAAVTEAMAHVDGFIHLAGLLGTQETIANPRPVAETNILGGLNVLEAAILYSVPGVNVAVGNPWMNNPYAISKATVERFVEMFQVERGGRFVNVRVLNAYGPRQLYGPSKVRKVMPTFIMSALNDLPIEIYGAGTQIMDMIHVRDVARVLVSALLVGTTLADPPLYSAGSGVPSSVNDLADEVVRTVGKGSVSYSPMRPGEPPQSIVLGDPSSLETLGIYPEDLTPLSVGVKETVEWYREEYSL